MSGIASVMGASKIKRTATFQQPSSLYNELKTPTYNSA